MAVATATPQCVPLLIHPSRIWVSHRERGSAVPRWDGRQPGVWLSVTPDSYEVSGFGSGGTGAGMNSDTILAMSGLMALAAAVLTGALWGTPVVMASFRWFIR
jgi:hypothetical protein